MLYNPQHNLNTIYSTDNLINWLETQNPDETYVYVDNRDCLMCRYFKAMGLQIDQLDATGYTLDSAPHEWVGYPKMLNQIAIYGNGRISGALAIARYIEGK